jgi:hypothetical protein
MLCAHCCFDCGPDGEDISSETFEHALEYAKHRQDEITLGGGEPTIHPQFEEFLVRAMEARPNRVCVITNGKYAKGVNVLLRYAMTKQVFAKLSADQYHEPIDKAIVDEFNALPAMWEWGSHHLGTTHIERVLPFGRATRLTTATFRQGQCLCYGPFVTPSGHVQQCACEGHTVGHIERHHHELRSLPYGNWYCSRYKRMKLVQEMTGTALCAS